MPLLCRKSALKWPLVFILSSVAACSSLPHVEADSAQKAPVVVSADGPKSAHEGQAKLRQVSAEGRPALLKHHVGLLGALGEFTTADNETHLLVDGPATFKAKLADLEKARRSILLESYIYEDASLGQRVAEILKRKQREGVEVRLIYDAVGSLTTPRSFFEDLSAAGVLVCEFNPVRTSFPFRPDKLNHRDHRKITVVDGQVAYTGGINISDVYSAGSSSFLSRRSDDEDSKRGWRDTSVRIRGPAVTDFEMLFADTWMRQGCAQAPQLPSRQATPRSGDRLVTVLGSSPADKEARIYRAMLTAITGAQHSIHMTMSYFVPDGQTVDALKQAAGRGVDVTLILQGMSDSTLVLRTSQSYYGELLAAGIRIYERSDTLLHAKTVVIDGVWSTVGSSNVDWRSFLHNDEVNVIVLGAEFADEMEQQFQRDLGQSQHITAERWAERSALRRLQERFGRLFEYWL